MCIDASGMAVRVHAEKAASAEEEQQRPAACDAYGECWVQKRQVRTYFCLDGAGNRGENVKNAASQGRAGGTKEKTDMGG